MMKTNHFAGRLRPTLFAALISIVLLAPHSGAIGQTQTDSSDLESLAVELWPDYDRPAMLVLLTGRLPEDAELPATVVVPLPPDADLNAVARFNESNVLIADVAYQVDETQLTMTLPNRGFRVEYYAPYAVEGDDRSYRFNWLAPANVGSLTALVQQPLAAADLTIRPTPLSVGSERGDGMLYHSLPSQSVAAGRPYAIDVRYTATTDELSASPQQSAPSAGSGDVSPATVDEPAALSGGVNVWWIVGFFGVATLVGAAWYLGRRQAAGVARPAKPRPARPAGNKSAPSPPPETSDSGNGPKFCHNCGEPTRPGDRFCRNCGAKLKGA